MAQARGIEAYLVDGPEEICAEWLAGKENIGITAGASAPEVIVERVVNRICKLTNAEVKQLIRVEEAVSFPLPKGLSR